MKISIITGAGIRIGRSIAEKLAANGYHVICHANRSIEKAEQLVQSIKSNGGSAESIAANLSNIEEVIDMGKRLRTAHPKIDLLVNNAGIYDRIAFDNIDIETYRTMQRINVEAPFFLTQQLLPSIRKAKGSIINITDSSVIHPYSHYSHYFISKAGLENVTQTLALELAPDIRVNAVAPGTVAFPPNFNHKLKQSIQSAIPLQRIGVENDIAEAVYYLTEIATFTTGQILRIDGGRSIS